VIGVLTRSWLRCSQSPTSSPHRSAYLHSAIPPARCPVCRRRSTIAPLLNPFILIGAVLSPTTLKPNIYLGRPALIHCTAPAPPPIACSYWPSFSPPLIPTRHCEERDTTRNVRKNRLRHHQEHEEGIVAWAAPHRTLTP
jgi:hypothetical protein